MPGKPLGEPVDETELDWLNIAEEIESVGANTRRELRNRLARLLQHLLKWHYQPALRSRSWRLIIVEQRDEIEELLAENPSLRGRLPEMFGPVYAKGRRWAETETGLLSLPGDPPFDLEQAMHAELPGQESAGAQATCGVRSQLIGGWKRPRSVDQPQSGLHPWRQVVATTAWFAGDW